MAENNQQSFGFLRWLGILVLIATGFLLAIGSSAFIGATNTAEFCTSCHSMQWVKEEWMESFHYSNASGVRAVCSDCHVPHSLGPKLVAKVMAAKDVWGEIMGTIDSKEKFEQHRWEMANRVWTKMEATDSRECRSCHSFKSMDMSEQAKLSRKKHKRAKKEGQTCIECHRGVAHEEPLEPDTEDS